MSSITMSRAALRQTTKLTGRPARRFESTTSKATDAAKDATLKAKETAANIQSKASEGLSRVTSAAGPALSGAAKGVGNALGKIGGRTGKLIGAVERAIPPTIYYSKVGLELSKLVFQGQKMAPPPVSTFQAYFQRVLKSARNPKALFQTAEQTASKTSPESVLERIQGLSRAQLVAGGVVAAELLGFFTVGEIIGRMKLVGYRGDAGAHH